MRNIEQYLMPPEEKLVIRKFAAGDETMKREAISIYRNNIPLLGVRGTLEMQFMSEYTHPVPDLALRNKYRIRLIELMEEGES